MLLVADSDLQETPIRGERQTAHSETHVVTARPRAIRPPWPKWRSCWSNAENPVIVRGPLRAHAGGHEALVELAETLQAPVSRRRKISRRTIR